MVVRMESPLAGLSLVPATHRRWIIWLRSRRTPPITGKEAGPLLHACELRGPDFGLLAAG